MDILAKSKWGSNGGGYKISEALEESYGIILDKINSMSKNLEDNPSTNMLLDELIDGEKIIQNIIQTLNSLGKSEKKRLSDDIDEWVKEGGDTNTSKQLKSKWLAGIDDCIDSYKKEANNLLKKYQKAIKEKEKEQKSGGKKAYSRFDTKAESKEYAEFQAHKIVSAAFDKVFRR